MVYLAVKWRRYPWKICRSGNGGLRLTRTLPAAFTATWIRWMPACPCAAYQNYVRAATRFPPDVTAFFASLGIDGAKPAEIYACESRDGRVYYTGFYPLVGNRLSGDDAQRPDAPEPLGQTGADMWTLAGRLPRRVHAAAG